MTLNIMTSKEASAKWGFHRDYINRMCREGKVSGATKVGYYWVMPSDTPKPVYDYTARTRMPRTPQTEEIIAAISTGKHSLAAIAKMFHLSPGRISAIKKKMEATK